MKRNYTPSTKLGFLLKEFLESEKSGGLILIGCTLLSLLITNSNFGDAYHHLWEYQLGNLSVELWINDCLMAIFFLLIGLELKREIYVGELSDFKGALFPIFAALGGVLVPAGIYMLFNHGTPTQSGTGIPMATDIAFALGVLSLLGNRVPVSLKVFLTALAVIDDLAAILVIAIFYSQAIFWTNLVIALALFLLMLVMNKLKINYLLLYLLGGAVMWYFMLHSGIHATITGVLLAFAIPSNRGDKDSPSYRLQDFLHEPVAFFILPLFALANTAIDLSGNFLDVITQPYSLGIAFGLIVGKPVGIFLLSFLTVSVGLCKRPEDLKWKTIFACGILGGIGFTMSIFITLLAFEDAAIINNAKLIILLSSFIAGLIGFFALKLTLKKSGLEGR